MSLLEVSELAFGYAGEALIQNVSLRLEAGERIALVAPNGVGKTTLLRLIAGELSPDRGQVQVGKNVRVGYYRQSHELDSSGSVLDALLSGFSELVELRHELTHAQADAAGGGQAELRRLAELTDRWQHTGADRLESRVQTIASRLGFAQSDFERPVTSLSGGERGRLGLGVVLATEPELLLLDEPTNHLDLDTIGWLESYLRAFRGGLLVVSHDRAFLDAACPITLELGRRALRSYAMAFSAYEQFREAELERERKQFEEQRAFVERTEDFIRKNIAGQKTKQAKSRRKLLDRLEKVELPEDLWAQAERLRLRFADAPRSGEIVLEATGLSAERGQKKLFSGVDLLVRRGDRIGIVGANGCGKTTLLKLLAGLGGDEDSGQVRRGSNLCDGYFDQALGSLDDEKTGVDEIRSIRGELSSDAARQYLGRFRLSGDDALRRVASLSGGERTRLALAKLLLEPRNLLFLDEPTNHLDIPATQILEEALVGFAGTLLLVSHDRRFLERVTTRTLAFAPDGIDIYEGGFADWVAALQRQQAAALEPDASKARRPLPSAKVQNDAEAAAERHAARRAAQRELERKKRRVRELESSIAEAEEDVRALRAELAQAPGHDWEKLHALAERERRVSQQLEQKMAEWMRLSEELAERGALVQEAEP